MLALVLSVAYAPLAAIAASAPPAIISYQGRLTDSGGSLLGGSGTTYYFKFSIWDSPTVGSGNRVWPIATPATSTATVRDGVFTVNIGDTANGYPDPLNVNFANYSALYLQVEVSSDNNSSETLSPRQQLTSAVYAQLAGGVVGTTTQSAFGTTTPVANSYVTIQATSSAVVPLTVLGTSGQSANIFQVQNNSLQNLFSISSAGAVALSGAITSTATAANTLPFASTTALTVSGTGYFSTASTTNLTISSLGGSAGQCLTTNASGVVSATSCGSGAAFPFAPSAFGATASNATSTLIGFTNGIYSLASSTIGNGTAAGGLTVAGTATTTNLVVSSLSSGRVPFASTGGKLTDSANLVFNNALQELTIGSSGTSYLDFSGTLSHLSSDGSGNLELLSAGSLSLVTSLGHDLALTTDHNLTVTANNAGGDLNFTSFSGATFVANGSGVRFAFTGANLGVGTTSPFATLSVAGNYGDTNPYLFVIASSTSVSATTTLFSVSNTGSTTIANGINLTAGCYAVNGTCLATGGSGAAFAWTPTQNFGVNTNATSTALSLLGGLNASSTIRFGNAGVGGFLFDSSTGRLGLGTTSPFTTLAVQKTYGSTNDTLFAIASSTASNGSTADTLFSIDSAGKTTFGNSAGTGDARLQFASNANAWSFGYASTTKSFIIASSTDLSSNIALSILKGGNVGLGTTSPYKTLSVGGDVVVGAASAGGTLGNLYLPALTSQSCLGTDSAGKVQAGTCSGGSGTFSWTPSALGNATSTLLLLNAGLIAAASSTIGNGAQSGGLTISGGATTTGNLYVGGNIGIGTKTPQSALEVYGGSLRLSGSGNTGISLTGRNQYGLDYVDITALDSGNGAAVNFTPQTSGVSLPYDFQFNSSNGNESALLLIGQRTSLVHRIGVSNDATGGSPWDLVFSVAPNNTNWSSSSYDALTIKAGTPTNTLLLTSAGNVGLSTSSPFAQLSVQKSYGSSNSTLFAIGSSTASNGSSASTLFSVDSSGLTTVGNSSGGGDANFQFASDNNAWSAGYFSTDKSFRIASSTNLSSNVALTILKNSTLNVGLSSTTPWRTLSINGTVAINGLSAVSGTDQSVCIDPSTKELTTQSGDTCAVSSARFKHDITSLPDGGLDMFRKLRPVSFQYNGDLSSTTYWGFIAEEAASTSPALAYFNPDGSVQTINTTAILSLTAKALGELDLNLSTIASTTASSTVASTTFAQNFFNNLFNRFIGWFADASNGIMKFFAHEVHTDTLCIKKSDGSDVCVTGDQLSALLSNQAAAPAAPAPSADPAPADTTPSSDSSQSDGSSASAGDTTSSPDVPAADASVDTASSDSSYNEAATTADAATPDTTTP